MSVAGARYHVITYVDRGGEGRLEALALGTLEAPVAGKEGAHTEAIVGEVAGFTCDGHGDSTNGCTATHAHARERIIARLGEKGEAAVTWRRYHPRIAAGTAAPGQPFESVDPKDGTRIRVEVREIALDNPAALLTNDRISPLGIQALEAELKQKQVAFKRERELDGQVRAALQAVTGQAHAKLDAAIAAAGDLVRPEDREALAAVAQEQIKGLLEGLRAKVAKDGPKDVPNAQQLLLKAVDAALVPLHEAKDRAIAIRDRAEELATVSAEIEDLLQDLGHRCPPANRSAIEALAARAAGSSSGSVPVGGQNARLEAITEIAHALRQQADALGPFAQKLAAEKEAFAQRVSRIEDWCSGKAIDRWVDHLRQGQGYPGFSVRYWTQQAQAVGLEIAKNADPQPPLAFDCPEDDARLAQIESRIGKLVKPFARRLDEELTRRAKGAFRTARVAGRDVALPHASVRVLACDGNKLRVEVDARSQDALPMLVELQMGDGKRIALPLQTRGERARTTLDQVVGPFEFHIVGVLDEQNTHRRVDVRSQPIALELVGAHQFAAQAGYQIVTADAGELGVALQAQGEAAAVPKIPSPDEPSVLLRTITRSGARIRIERQRIPGEEA